MGKSRILLVAEDQVCIGFATDGDVGTAFSQHDYGETEQNTLTDATATCFCVDGVYFFHIVTDKATDTLIYGEADIPVEFANLHVFVA